MNHKSVKSSLCTDVRTPSWRKFALGMLVNITRNSSHFVHAILLFLRFIENLQSMLVGIRFPKQNGAFIREM